MSTHRMAARWPLTLWLLTGAVLSMILFAGYYAATPWADDWIFIGRSETLAAAISSIFQRLVTWSPRPGSEPTIFGSLYLARRLGLAPESLIIPLLIASYVQSLSLLFWPALLRRFRHVGYGSLSLSLACMFMAAALMNRHQTDEVLFWGAGAAAYLPTLAAWISGLCCLYLWVATRESLFFRVAVLQCFFGGLFWEVGVSGSVVIPGTVLLLVCLFDQKSQRVSGRRDLFSLFGSVLLSAVVLSVVLLPASLQRHQLEAAGGLSFVDALRWAFRWPVAHSWHLVSSHFLFTVPFVALLSVLLLAQVRLAAAVPPGSRLQRQALFCCGVSALLESVAIRFCLATSFGAQSVYQQRHEIAPTLLLLLGLSFLLAAAMPSGLLDWIRPSRPWVTVAAVSMMFAGVSSSPSVHGILGDAALTATGHRPSPITISAKESEGIYDLTCKKYAYAEDLPPGTWTPSSLRSRIEAKNSFGEGYKLKIIRGVMSGYGIDRLITTPDHPVPCT
jgi:hypothetical protein